MNLVTGPRQPRRETAPDESANEPTKLIEEESVDVEEGTPAEGNQPVETVEDDSETGAPAFEE